MTDPYVYLPIRQPGDTGPRLTPRHVAHAVAALTEARGRPPSYQELSEVFSVSRARVGQLIAAARKAGKISRGDGRHRTLVQR